MNQIITLLANSDWMVFLWNPAALVFAIPIIAILVGGIIAIAKLLIRHRERMAMIERGMHPDHPQDQNDSPNQS
jgi:Flp pilus assembly protein protease CpaA